MHDSQANLTARRSGMHDESGDDPRQPCYEWPTGFRLALVPTGPWQRISMRSEASSWTCAPDCPAGLSRTRRRGRREPRRLLQQRLPTC